MAKFFNLPVGREVALITKESIQGFTYIIPIKCKVWVTRTGKGKEYRFRWVDYGKMRSITDLWMSIPTDLFEYAPQSGHPCTTIFK